MTTENHHSQLEANDNGAVISVILPVNSIPGEITEIEYESALEGIDKLTKKSRIS